MLIKCTYRQNGFAFQILLKDTPLSFPLTDLKKAVLRDPDWPALNSLEQLYFQGYLRREDGGYLLSPEDFYSLDRDMLKGINIPGSAATISVEENGNIGAKTYSISWYLIVHKKNAGKSIRRGCVASAADFDFILTEQQYHLICELESWTDNGFIEDRARFQAKIKYLAQNAGAILSKFTEKREFYFSDHVDLVPQNDGDRCIRFIPRLCGVPEYLSDDLPASVSSVNYLYKGGKQISVFTSPEAEIQYNRISSISDIYDTDIPRFIENPLQFLPEDVSFNPDDFAKRVKGLSIRTAKAVPYIRIEQEKEDDAGWLSFSYGTTFQDCGYSDEEEIVISETPELKKRILEAIQNGEEYVYYNQVWIKINPQVMQEHYQLRDDFAEKYGCQNGLIQKKSAKKILEIYQNLEGMEYRESWKQLGKGEPISPYPLPQSFSGTLKPYQFSGYCFLMEHYAESMGVLLADDMGLGKTVQVIALLAFLYDKNWITPALLTLPLTLVDNWISELDRFLPAVRDIYVHQGIRRYKNPLIIGSHQIVITTYETLARDQSVLGRIRWSCVICDEAQKVKNFNTLAAGAVKGMNTPFRIAVTGTPVENRLSELWSITDFVQPGLLNSYKKFRDDYEKPIQADGPQKEMQIDRLVTKISPVFIRRKKEDVLAGQLPSKTEVTIPIPLNIYTLSLYSKVLRDRKACEKPNALADIQRLIMLCSHPRLITKQGTDSVAVKDLVKESPKLKWTLAQLCNIQKAQEKAIIFTRYLTMQAILRQCIYEEFHLDAPIINGSVKDNRMEIIRKFEQTDGFHVMILSPRAAGVGLNIVGANHVIHYTREWNPAVENQATDRVYRIGQKRPVTVYYPITVAEGFQTVDSRLDELLKDKREIMKRVIIPQNLEIKAEDFYDLLQKAEVE